MMYPWSPPGQALRGSSDLHAIGDSNAYLTRHNEKIVLTIEHRAAACPQPMTLELISDPDNLATQLRVCRQSLPPTNYAAESLDEQILQLLAQQSSPLSRTAIRARLRVNNDRLGKCLLELEQRGRLHRCPEGWTLMSYCSGLPGETDAGSADVQPAEG